MQRVTYDNAAPAPSNNTLTKVALLTLYCFKLDFSKYTKSLFIILRITKNPFVRLTIALLLKGLEEEHPTHRESIVNWKKNRGNVHYSKTSLHTILETFKNGRMLMRLRYTYCPMTDTFENERKKEGTTKNENKIKKLPTCKDKGRKKKNKKLCTFMSVRCTEKVTKSNLDEQVCRKVFTFRQRFSIVLKRYLISQKCIRLRGKGSIP